MDRRKIGAFELALSCPTRLVCFYGFGVLGTSQYIPVPIHCIAVVDLGSMYVNSPYMSVSPYIAVRIRGSLVLLPATLGIVH